MFAPRIGQKLGSWEMRSSLFFERWFLGITGIVFWESGVFWGLGGYPPGEGGVVKTEGLNPGGRLSPLPAAFSYKGYV